MEKKMNIAQDYPKIFERLEDKEVALRHLLNVDENYDDYDSEEFDFEPDEYNYIIYIADPLKAMLDEEKLETLMIRLNDNAAFSAFLPTEPDLYGVKTELGEEEIAALVLAQIEEIV